MAKKNKVSTPAAVAKKNKKKLKGGIEKKGKPQEEAAANVFETIWNRRKFDVLGKKHKKGESRRVGLSRSLAVEKRKDTLLQEYKKKGKGNTFVDRRFGENDDGLGEDDKAIIRFQKERQAQLSHQSKFALRDDDEEEEEILTHGGMALSNVDDYHDNDKDSMEDDDYLDGLSKEEVMALNFGGGSTNDGRNNGSDGQKQKTKKEIMEEIIAKSKFYKAQKAKEKEEDQDLEEKLDKDFTELVQSQALSSLFRPTRKDNLKSLLTIGSSSKDKSSDKGKEEEEKPDDFDKIMKEMVFDMRGRATDRLKTDEELIKEEREHLEEMENKRKQRMLGEDSEDDSVESDDEAGKLTKRGKKKKRREISGDDLGENFVLDDEDKKGTGWVDEVMARRDDEEADSDEEEGSDEDEDGSDEMEEEDGEDEEGDSEEEESEEETREELLEKVRIALEKKKKREEDRAIAAAKRAAEAQQELEALPFVIDAPQTLGDFRALVDRRTNEELVLAIQRIRTCNAISLAADNRRKMQIFYNVLLQYFGTSAMEKPLLLSRLNLLTKPLIELSMETPYFAATCARQRLVHMHTQITERLKVSDGSSCWPSLRTLLLLRFWSMIFPPSDLRHPVMTPAILFMSEVLCRCPITSGRDVAVGSFLCTLLLSALREARRFCPEALNFIMTLLVSALPSQASGKLGFARSVCPAFMVEIGLEEQWLVLKNSKSSKKDVESPPLDFVALMTAEENDIVFTTNAFRVGILRTLLQNLNGFISLYEDVMSFPEVFSPVLQVLKRLKEESVVRESLAILHAQATEVIETKLAEHERLRQPLRMRIQKRMPIKQFNPKFEENYVQGRNYDPDRERSEKKKLQRRVKSEFKGAARELRKDNYFLMEEKAKEKQAAEEERKEKFGKAMAFLQEQESAFKSGQMGKGKGRRRK